MDRLLYDLTLTFLWNKLGPLPTQGSALVDLGIWPCNDRIIYSCVLDDQGLQWGKRSLQELEKSGNISPSDKTGVTSIWDHGGSKPCLFPRPTGAQSPRE